ncbi:MAG: DNA (cytosine-5-)-methyltransferase [bacterium]
MIKYLDMFSGIGGFRLAFDNAGFKSVGFCEIDPYSRSLYKAYFDTDGEVEIHDATKIKPEELPNFDILVGGFPCQAFSIAGKRRGFEDTRGTLFFDIVRILSYKKPEYFLLENVKGLLSHDSGRTFAAIIKILTDIGYRVEWQLLNSKFFGVPQNRERVFIVGCLGGKCAGKIFPVSGIGTENSDKIGRPKRHPLSKCGSQGNRVYSTDGTSSCLTSQGGGQGGKTGLYFIDKSEYKASDTVQTLKIAGDTPLIRVRNGTKKGFEEAEAGDGINLAYPQSKTRRGRVGKKVSQTLDTHCNMGTIDGCRIRRLTPLECFRLQGFSDEMLEKAKELGLSDNRLYKMAGNAVTVQVVETIARKIMKAIQEENNA